MVRPSVAIKTSPIASANLIETGKPSAKIEELKFIFVSVIMSAMTVSIVEVD